MWGDKSAGRQKVSGDAARGGIGGRRRDVVGFNRPAQRAQLEHHGGQAPGTRAMLEFGMAGALAIQQQRQGNIG